MPYTEYRGNLFSSKAQTLVNTVNCLGVMGKGIALEFRRRFPEMFEAYRKVCDENQLKPGQILPFRKGSPWVLSLAAGLPHYVSRRIEGFHLQTAQKRASSALFSDCFDEFRRKHSAPALSLAVKADWKQPSRLEWVESCLQRFAENYQRLGIVSVAFPWIGAMNGGLPWNSSAAASCVSSGDLEHPTHEGVIRIGS